MTLPLEPGPNGIERVSPNGIRYLWQDATNTPHWTRSGRPTIHIVQLDGDNHGRRVWILPIGNDYRPHIWINHQWVDIEQELTSALRTLADTQNM